MTALPMYGLAIGGGPMVYLILKYLHVAGAIVILGTGTGIAFFMAMAHRSRDPSFIGRTAGIVVLADLLFTATAVALQPVTGYLLMQQLGVGFEDRWIALSLLLYLLAGAFWLPVVWIQTRMRDLALAAARTGAGLPLSYHRLYRIWFLFGIPGFGSVATILWLMIAKPGLGG